MLNSKHSLSSSKNNRYNGKLKEILSLSHSKCEPKIDIKDFSNVPLIRQKDNEPLLPKYSTILGRNGDEGIVMDDLDQLQQDLEKLLSTNALRTRFFLGEYTQADQKDGPHDKTSLKRKRSDDKPKYDLKNGLRLMKREITLPRNDNSDKFWASIEPYCASVDKEDVTFLDNIIQEFSKDIELNIPEIGEHYASTWSEDLINDEQNLGKTSKKPVDIKKNILQLMVETFGTRHAQLFSGLSTRKTNNTIKNIENGVKINKLKTSDLTKMKQVGQKVGPCFEKRLIKVLIEQGILSEEDANQTAPDDEILTELKKCQQELLTVNKYNLEELKKLRTAVLNDIHCNQLKEDLNKVDKEVLDLYNSIMQAKIKDEGKEYDKILNEKTINEYESKANALLKQQHVLNREINSMTDMSMLY
ncbi:hypothetical protein ABEB36_010626 [Hypothenemus hampei]|uniref:Uncharacterized protein n=1 Tax=Hypothenemus hampei TaxID=57062 RepID=A0ABD1ECJ2_HYPHA